MEQLRPSQPIENIPIQLIDKPETPVDIPTAYFNASKPETHTKEFSIGEMKEEPGKIKIDFFGGEKPNDFIKTQTEPAKTISPGGETTYINPLANPTANNPLNPQKSKEEIRGSVTTIIAVFDYGLSFLGMWIAGEGTQTQYTADTVQKKIVESALTDFFYEKQVKMSPVWGLVLAVLGAWGFMLIKAGKTRFDKKKNTKTIPINRDRLEPPLNPVYTTPTKPITPTPVSMAFEKTNDSISDIKQTFRWLNPDPKIIAASNQDILDYVRRGIYPMHIKSKRTNKVRKVNYNPQTGEPIILGKPTRL